ncbi:protein ROOT HAIR DEFECTIVE 3 homolog 2-like [Mangifera indica]|uniref:protein ROOT HAIR DEFECTIVE 3 homolog 2-like n=1 Tax=Mangifera indica TaxID=29780 RepID=UPI001CF9651A|nr:protein ROOT HAIR DEFECTIVE 3 homolog 2-like [Mangifera indica]
MAQLSPLSVQLISSNGDLNVDGLENFVRATNLPDRGLSYSVVAIMGPQSSGKSTLMNHLFYTNFKEMDASDGRSQTTKGIWIDKCVDIEPFTIVMDLEGTDGTERGEDDTAFEKQSALFAVAIADVVLINIWCHDIGREQAGSRPLLKTVFQVMMRLFSSRKTTLLFVIRDKTKTPVEKLGSNLREDIQKIWEAFPKPQDHDSTPLSEFFNVEVIALSSYEEKEQEFKEQVAQLRQRFFHSISPGGLAGDRQEVVPASVFSFSVQQIWKLIKENKDLNLPAHKVMVATFRCEEIANVKLCLLSDDKGRLALEEAIQVGPIPGFGKEAHTIIDTYLSDYDKETIYFDEAVRTRKRQDLESKAIHIFYRAYTVILDHLQSKGFDSFKISLEQLLKDGEGFASAVRTCLQSCMLEFDQGCADAAIRLANWDASKVQEELLHDIHEHASSLLHAKLSEIKAKFEEKLTAGLTEPAKYLFAAGSEDTWASLRKLLGSVTEAAVLEYLNAISGFELDQATSDTMVQNLESSTRNLIKKVAREEAGKVLNRMKERFSTVFNHDSDSMRRVWPEVDIKTAVKDAQTASLSVLSDRAVIRLDEKPDMVKNLLFSSLMGGTVDALASNTWEEVSPINVLKSPMECMSLWDQFKKETQYMVDQAISAQLEAQKGRKSWLSSLWVVAPLVSAFFGLAVDEVKQNM